MEVTGALMQVFSLALLGGIALAMIVAYFGRRPTLVKVLEVSGIALIALVLALGLYAATVVAG